MTVRDPQPLPWVIDSVVRHLLDAEGGVANVGDGEGITRYGQTRSWLERWHLPIPRSRDEAAMNYHSWIEQTNLDVLCTVDDVLPWAVIDFAVNSGERVAIASMQRALGLRADGLIGPKTMTAVIVCQRKQVAAWVLADRLELDGGLIAHHPDQYARFALGWLRRIGQQVKALA